ncbi:MAG TPA: D-amino acid aminotransferase [Gammaproteobacteria bacterium]|nr:D-amino acid aminotransferase [Gammaproteobacteria bacterium]
MPGTVYLNGDYLPLEDAKVSVMDRGFLFGDGVYEVIPVYDGKLVGLKKHLQRLQNSLDRVTLDNPLSAEQWLSLFSSLLDKNTEQAGQPESAIYLQITRGVYPKRDLVIDPQYPPTVFAMVLPVTPPDLDRISAGITAITVDDFRWNACDIKSTSLIGNVMLKQQARAAGVDDAILIRDGLVTEGTASNVFLVKDEVLVTPPTSRCLLPGITRDLVIEIAKNNTILVEEREIKQGELDQADEIWMTSSTREIAPVIQLDGKAVSQGRAGDMWKHITGLYQQYKQSIRA